MSPSRIGLAEARLRHLGLGGSNLLSSFSMRCQRSSGKAQSVKIRALSAIGLFVLRLINQSVALTTSLTNISTPLPNGHVSTSMQPGQRFSHPDNCTTLLLPGPSITELW